MTLVVDEDVPVHPLPARLVGPSGAMLEAHHFMHLLAQPRLRVGRRPIPSDRAVFPGPIFIVISLSKPLLDKDQLHLNPPEMQPRKNRKLRSNTCWPK